MQMSFLFLVDIQNASIAGYIKYAVGKAVHKQAEKLFSDGWYGF